MTWKKISISIHQKLKAIPTDYPCDTCNQPLTVTYVKRRNEDNGEIVYVGNATCLNEECSWSQMFARPMAFNFDKNQWEHMNRSWYVERALKKILRDT